MFNEVGTKMKTIAKLKMVVLLLPFIAVGAIVWYLLAQEDYGFVGFLAFVATSGYGCFVAWLNVVEFYAFGELVETVVDINIGVDNLLENSK